MIYFKIFMDISWVIFKCLSILVLSHKLLVREPNYSKTEAFENRDSGVIFSNYTIMCRIFLQYHTIWKLLRFVSVSRFLNNCTFSFYYYKTMNSRNLKKWTRGGFCIIFAGIIVEMLHVNSAKANFIWPTVGWIFCNFKVNQWKV